MSEHGGDWTPERLNLTAWWRREADPECDTCGGSGRHPLSGRFPCPDCMSDAEATLSGCTPAKDGHG